MFGPVLGSVLKCQIMVVEKTVTTDAKGRDELLISNIILTLSMQCGM